ncbi:hypothetical protein C8F04DRAFT_137326 [Mycena alexandri]|uniref:Uncharacterized protein n=1 Tax=Mycena alexandri TaxID=1745969 RepID=A0AAD6SCJ7_9AGAR|nr:hypothetical protein C8F04DRAFT_137326 [Mycena alexandri]
MHGSASRFARKSRGRWGGILVEDKARFQPNLRECMREVKCELRGHTATDAKMFLSAATKNSLTEVLSLVQKTVLNAASELEDEAQSQVARLHSELNVARSERDEARNERDEALKSLHVAEITASKHANELAQMRATVENLQREVVHWKEQAKNWQDHYTRVEQDRCGLSTELLTLSRSALTESPPKHYYSNSAPNSHMKRSSTSSNRPPAYKSAIPPSPSESDSPLQSVSAPRNPRTPASKPVRQQQPVSARSELPPYHSADASASESGSAVNRSGGSGGVAQQQPPRSAKAAGKQPQVQTPSQAPRQIFVRRVHAVVHVKEEEGDDDLEDDEEESAEVPDSNVRLVKRRRSGLMVQDDDDVRSASGSEAEGAPRGRDEESGDELMMDSRQEIYGGVHPVLPTPQPTLRLKRLANVAPQAEATPTKRRRVSDAARVKVPAKKK